MVTTTARLVVLAESVYLQKHLYRSVFYNIDSHLFFFINFEVGLSYYSAIKRRVFFHPNLRFNPSGDKLSQEAQIVKKALPTLIGVNVGPGSRSITHLAVKEYCGAVNIFTTHPIEGQEYFGVHGAKTGSVVTYNNSVSYQLQNGFLSPIRHIITNSGLYNQVVLTSLVHQASYSRLMNIRCGLVHQ